MRNKDQKNQIESPERVRDECGDLMPAGTADGYKGSNWYQDDRFSAWATSTSDPSLT